MFAQVALPEQPSERKTPPARPLDEAVWQAWLAEGRAREQRGRGLRMQVVTVASIAALLAAAGLTPLLTPYAVVVRFIVAAAAIAAMLQAFHARRYALAGVFGTLALLYNPIVPVFSFSGDWWRALLAVSAVPFVVSLASRKIGVVDHD